MKKRCPACERLRRIGKFYNNSFQPDGKQIQCKDCSKPMNIQSRMNESYKIGKRKRDKEWRKKNSILVQKYNSDYYQRNKERIKSRRNTESIIIIENPDKKKINTSRYNRKKFIDDIVINPQRKNDG